MVDILEESKGNLLALRVKGEISERDFEVFNPMLEKTIKEHEEPLAYVELMDLEKVTPEAVKEDLSNIPQYNEFKKIAIVGDAKWQEMLSRLGGALVKPSLKYFNFDEKANAMEWLKH